jgi:regulatory protein
MGPSNATAHEVSLKARALRWLSQREYSRRELRTKLLRSGANESTAADVEALLDQLVAQGHLSDARFVESRVHARHARFGNHRIEHELRQHGLVLDPELRQQLHVSELARAHEVWRKKFGSLATDATGRARHARFLAARGFSAEVVHKIVTGDHGLAADDHDDDSA